MIEALALAAALSKVYVCSMPPSTIFDKEITVTICEADNDRQLRPLYTCRYPRSDIDTFELLLAGYEMSFKTLSPIYVDVDSPDKCNKIYFESNPNLANGEKK